MISRSSNFISFFCLFVLSVTKTHAVDLAGGDPTSDYVMTALILLNGKPHCSGTLISNKVILTAAHCIEPLIKNGQIKTGALKVTFGDSYKKRFGEPYTVKNGIYPVDGDDAYNPKTLRNDVGLIYLNSEVNIFAIKPATLNDNPKLWTQLRDSKSNLTFVGYGADPLNKTNSEAGIKREASWYITNFDEKNISYKNNQTNTCYKDSGGPAYIGPQKSPTLYAIASGNTKNCVYGFSTRVDYYLGWINKHMNDYM